MPREATALLRTTTAATLLVAILALSLAPATPALSLDAVGAAEPVLIRFETAPFAARGVQVLYSFESVPAVYALATDAAIAALERDPRVRFVEPQFDIPFALDTSTIASRARDVWDAAVEPTTPVVRDGAGVPVDGAGIGIAVVDSGLDATHPDFQAEGKVGGNWVVTPQGLVSAPITHVRAPHGTHVAGIAAGNGDASGGEYKGAAPGATLYSFNIGAGGNNAFPAIAFDWILAHGHEQEPPIRVVTNSWGCNSAVCRNLNADSLHIELETSLAQAGYVVLFAVGNDEGNGIQATTNLEARVPTPGVIGVANFDDDDRGTRNGCVASSSSRGQATDPTTWPDVSAPGSRIMSTWAIDADQNTRRPTGENNYRTLSGTSMATPHVAGIVALMLQARGDLAPGDVEYLLKATATKLGCGTAYVRADATHTHDGSNFIEGHGLVDARAAVLAAQGFTGIPPAPGVEPIPDGYADIEPSVRVDDYLYASGDALGETAPTGLAPRGRVMQSNAPAVYETATFDEARTVGGFEATAWIGNVGELPAVHLNPPVFRARIELLKADGEVVPVAAAARPTIYGPSVGPVPRDFVMPLDAPITIEAGDRVRLTFVVTTSTLTNAEGTYAIYDDSALTPTRLGFGERIDAIAPFTAEHCAIREDCARIGGERQYGMLYCGNVDYRIVWNGPPGSTAFFACNGAAASCTIPGAAGAEWGHCEAISLRNPAVTGHTVVCGYRTTDGTLAGSGRCEAVTPVED